MSPDSFSGGVAADSAAPVPRPSTSAPASPMTLGDKLRGIARCADRDPLDVKWRVHCLLDELNNAEFAADMGAWMSNHLGDRTSGTKDRPINGDDHDQL